MCVSYWYQNYQVWPLNLLPAGLLEIGLTDLCLDPEVVRNEGSVCDQVAVHHLRTSI
jgi:hypothetical protein